MLFSIESRLPFLDYRLVEFCLSLPEYFKLRDGYPKKILRDAVASLPIEIKERKDKMGFVSPDENWVRENSSYFIEKMKIARDKYNFITDSFLNQFNLFLNGDRVYEAKYFRVISLVEFCEVFDLK
jgi:asparagine synthase (glutamine-hydrolysing)